MQKRLLGIFASMAIVLGACGGATTSSAPAESAAPGESAAAATPAPESNLADEQIMNISIHGEPPTLDPNKAQDSNSIAVLHALTRPLVFFDKDLNVVDELAESHEISADAQTITFKLRDAKYSNGDPIVAADFL